MVSLNVLLYSVIRSLYLFFLKNCFVVYFYDFSFHFYCLDKKNCIEEEREGKNMKKIRG